MHCVFNFGTSWRRSSITLFWDCWSDDVYYAQFYNFPPLSVDSFCGCARMILIISLFRFCIFLESFCRPRKFPLVIRIRMSNWTKNTSRHFNNFYADLRSSHVTYHATQHVTSSHVNLHCIACDERYSEMCSLHIDFIWKMTRRLFSAQCTHAHTHERQKSLVSMNTVCWRGFGLISIKFTTGN